MSRDARTCSTALRSSTHLAALSRAITMVARFKKETIVHARLKFFLRLSNLKWPAFFSKLHHSCWVNFVLWLIFIIQIFGALTQSLEIFERQAKKKDIPFFLFFPFIFQYSINKWSAIMEKSWWELPKSETKHQSILEKSLVRTTCVSKPPKRGPRQSDIRKKWLYSKTKVVFETQKVARYSLLLGEVFYPKMLISLALSLDRVQSASDFTLKTWSNALLGPTEEN